jgi:hypothetical protein
MSIDNNVIKLPTCSGPAPRGWAGMKARNQKRYSPAEWAIWGKLGDDARLVDTVRGSPAWLGDLHSGTWVLSINGMPFDEFEQSFSAIGEIADVQAFCPGMGTFKLRLVLVERPTKGPVAPRQRNRAPPAWTSEPPVPPGNQVLRGDRPRYLEFAARHPFVRRHVWLYGC